MTDKKKVEWLFKERINTRQIYEAIHMGNVCSKAVAILGPAGIGKTEIVRQYADKHYQGVCETVILSHYEVPDLVGQGIPVREADGKLYMRLAEGLLVPMDPMFKGILFLDEVTNIKDEMAHILYQLVNERRCGGRPLPEGMQIVLAGNRVYDNGASNELLGPLANRIMIYELEPEPQHWLEDFCPNANIHPAVYWYVEEDPRRLYEYGSVTDCPAFASGRSMESVSNVVKAFQEGACSFEVASASINGLIGDGKAIDFWPVYNAILNMPNPLELVQGKLTTFPISGIAGMTAVLNSCYYLITKAVEKDKKTGVEYAANTIAFLCTNVPEEKELFVTALQRVVKIGEETNNRDLITEAMKLRIKEFEKAFQTQAEFRQNVTDIIGKV